MNIKTYFMVEINIIWCWLYVKADSPPASAFHQFMGRIFIYVSLGGLVSLQTCQKWTINVGVSIWTFDFVFLLWGYWGNMIYLFLNSSISHPYHTDHIFFKFIIAIWAGIGRIKTHQPCHIYEPNLAHEQISHNYLEPLINIHSPRWSSG